MFGPLDRARRLNFDVPATSADRAFIDVRWQGPLAPTGATTTISRCAVADCTPTTLRPAESRSGPQDFGNRFDFDRGNASSLALRAATPEGFDVFDAEFPWPA